MTFTIKVKTAYKKGEWEVSTDDFNLKEKAPEIGDALRALHRRLITQLQQEKTVFQEVEGIVNSGAFDTDGVTVTMSTHKAGAE